MNNEAIEVKSEEVKKLEAAREPIFAAYDKIRKSICEKMLAIVESVVEESGVSGLAIRAADDGRRFDIYNSASEFHKMTIRFDEKFSFDNADDEVEISLGGYGSITAENPLLPVMRFAGYVAGKMKSLQAAFNACEWSELKKAKSDLWKADDAIREQEKAERVAERNRKFAAMEKLVVEGAVIKTPMWGERFRLERIEKVTDKCVFLKWNRVKKYDIISQLVAGEIQLATEAEIDAAVASKEL